MGLVFYKLFLKGSFMPMHHDLKVFALNNYRLVDNIKPLVETVSEAAGELVEFDETQCGDNPTSEACHVCNVYAEFEDLWPSVLHVNETLVKVSTR